MCRLFVVETKSAVAVTDHMDAGNQRARGRPFARRWRPLPIRIVGRVRFVE